VPTLAELLGGVGAPAAVAGVLLVLARLLGRRAQGAALAIGGAYVAAHLALRGWRGWEPRESTDWVLVCAAGATLAGILGLTRVGPTGLRLALRGLCALLVAWAVAGRVVARREGASAALGELALPALAAALVWSLLESRRYAGGERPTPVAPCLLMVVATCAALAIGLSGSRLLAQLAGAVAAALGAAFVVTRVGLAPALLPGAAAPVVATLFALVLAAVSHARLPLGCALLLAAAAVVPPPAPATASSASGSGAERSRRGVLRVALAATLAGAAVGLAWSASPPLDV
jgi:hypothetical protein